MEEVAVLSPSGRCRNRARWAQSEVQQHWVAFQGEALTNPPFQQKQQESDMPRIENENIIRTMRGIAWERAKGELQSVSATFWGEGDKYAKFAAAVKEFIAHVEDNGLAE